MDKPSQRFRISHIPKWLIEPSAGIRDPRERTRVRILSGVLLWFLLTMLINLTALLIALPPGPDKDQGMVPLFVVIPLFALSYGLSRTSRPMSGYWLWLITMSTAMFAVFLVFRDLTRIISLLEFSVVLYLITVLTLPFRQAVTVVLAHFLTMATLQALVPVRQYISPTIYISSALFWGIGTLLIGVATYFRDRAEAIADQRQRDLIAISRLSTIGTLAAGVAHEINNPLAVVRIILEKELCADPVRAQKMRSALSQVDRIAVIVQNLKSFSRDSSNDPRVEVPLPDLIRETMQLFNQGRSGEAVSVKVDSVTDAKVVCNPAQISQVLLNLLQNASDAVSEIEAPRISMICSESEELIRIGVQDNGAGVPAQIRARIFDAFFTTKDPGKGTGLGLSIAADIISDHGGRLYIDENSPQTTFIVELPRALA